jgi:hypothetical protein
MSPIIGPDVVFVARRRWGREFLATAQPPVGSQYWYDLEGKYLADGPDGVRYVHHAALNCWEVLPRVGEPPAADADAEPKIPLPPNMESHRPALLALRGLSRDQQRDAVNVIWQSRYDYHGFGFEDMERAVLAVIRRRIMWCAYCDTPGWRAGAKVIAGSRRPACDRCLQRCSRCQRCNAYLWPGREVIFTAGPLDPRQIGPLCVPCCELDYEMCHVCRRWYPRAEHHDMAHRCQCVARHPQFRFRLHGGGWVGSDTRFAVTQPAGRIGDPGLEEIHRLMLNVHGSTIAQMVYLVDSEWQLRDGNYSKRLARAVYKQYLVKMEPDVLARVGAIAKEHAGASTAWYLEFTRDLNGPVTAYANPKSCWWGGFSRSRCTMKENGGLGLRSYDSMEVATDRPNGRVWILPIDARMNVTEDVEGASGFALFNGYGRLQGYAPARIIAQMCEMTYRKVSILAGDNHILYVNQQQGYLVSDPATCDAVSEWYPRFQRWREEEHVAR